MPKGLRVDWTRESLERIQAANGSNEATALAEEIGIATATIYSVKKRLRDEGIDEILRKQSQRYETYVRGGNKQPETLGEQLGRIYLIRVGSAGRGGEFAQYSVTLPSHTAAAWVERWGRQIRFIPTEDGLLIRPVPPPPPPEIPAWLNGDRAADAEVASE